MKIWVQPGGDDRLVPLPGRKRQYFPKDQPTEVELDRYIARRLKDRDLQKVPAPAAAKPATATAPSKPQPVADTGASA